MVGKVKYEAYFHDAEGKTGVIERFVGQRGDGSREERSMRQDTVMATSAFGMRINVASIGMIGHVNEPQEMLEYAQESDRVLRDQSLDVGTV